MNTGKKAKAIDIVKQMIVDGQVSQEVAEKYFPELKQDWDERIRKELLNHCKDKAEKYSNDPKYNNISAWIAWLEMQGNFKSSKWTEGDVVRHGGILALVTNGRKAMKSNCEQITIQYPDEWVKAEKKERKYFFEELEKQGEQKHVAKYKVGDTIYYSSFGRLVSFVIANIVEDGTDNPMYEDKDGNSVFEKDLVEQKPTWSEDDKRKINRIYSILRQAADTHAFSTSCRLIGDKECIELQDWLKSLKQRIGG